MARPSRLQIAKRDIAAYFDATPVKVFRQKDIARILSDQRNVWRLTQKTTADEFVDYLKKHLRLVHHKFPFPYRREERFAWGDVPLLQILLTLKRGSYFSHYAAVRMHGLTEQLPKTIYLNHEQPPHPQNLGLQQDRIDNAFRRPQRTSRNVVEFDGWRICLVNGMHTGRLEVEEREVTYEDDRPVMVAVTSLERTLIDIAVRPAYSGGVAEVLNAYAQAREVVSVNRLAATLHKLRFTYPFHQAIGFYMGRAGYKPALLDLLRRFPMDYDFYLTHGMAQTTYVKDWRIYVPRGL